MIFLAPATVLESLVSRTAGQTETEAINPRAPFMGEAAEGDGAGGRRVERVAAADFPAKHCLSFIPAPLVNISAHVINPKLVRSFFSDRMNLPSGIFFHPRHGIKIITPSICVAFGIFSSSCRPLPFFLPWQPIPICTLSYIWFFSPFL